MSPSPQRVPWGWPRGRATAAVVASLVVLVAGCAKEGTEGSTEGFVSSKGITVVAVADRKAAPILAGRDLNGARLSSAQLREGNRILVVNVWGSWCSPCRSEAPVLAAASRRYAAQGVAFLGLLSRDKPAAALAFTRKFNIAYPSLQDPGGRLQLRFIDSLPSQGVPTTWIIDRENRVGARVVGEVSQSTLGALIEDELARK